MRSRFYVVQTQPSQETVARANLISQGFEVFLPTIIVERRHPNPRFAGRTSSSVEPLFSSYLFVKFDIDVDCWRSINGTRGVQRMLGGENPTAVPRGVIEDLQTRWAAGAFKVKTGSDRIAAGQPARVLSGPFEGLVGECLESRPSRVKLLLSVLGGAVRVVFAPSAVEPLAA